MSVAVHDYVGADVGLAAGRLGPGMAQPPGSRADLQGTGNTVMSGPGQLTPTPETKPTYAPPRLKTSTQDVLGVQGLRIRLPMQGMWVRPPAGETKIPYVTGQLSLPAATTEPTQSGAHVSQLERSLWPTTKSPNAATKTQCS